MVQSMRAIGPRDPDLVVNALVDYPVIWNWLLTAVVLSFHFLNLFQIDLRQIFLDIFRYFRKILDRYFFTESVCTCLRHVPSHRHLSSQGAIASSLLGNNFKSLLGNNFESKVGATFKLKSLNLKNPFHLYQVLSVTNIVHTIVIVLPTLFINFFGGAIAKFIEDQEVEQ